MKSNEYVKLLVALRVLTETLINDLDAEIAAGRTLKLTTMVSISNVGKNLDLIEKFEAAHLKEQQA